MSITAFRVGDITVSKTHVVPALMELSVPQSWKENKQTPILWNMSGKQRIY